MKTDNQMLQEYVAYWKRRSDLWERLYQLKDYPCQERDDIWEELHNEL